jgi:hypothetical protein
MTSCNALVYEAIQRVYRNAVVARIRSGMQAAYPDDFEIRVTSRFGSWKDNVRAAADSAMTGVVTHPHEDVFDYLDVSHFPVLLDKYFTVLAPVEGCSPEQVNKLKRQVLSYAREIQEIRNPLSHPGTPDIGVFDALRAVDNTMRALLVLGMPDAAKKIEPLRSEIASKAPALASVAVTPAQDLPRPIGAKAAGTRKLPQSSLDEKLRNAGADVLDAANRLRILGDEMGLPVVADGASLRIRDRLGSVVLLYPTYRSLEFDLRASRRPGHEAEIRDLQDALHQIVGTSKPMTADLPNVRCRDALANWEAVTEVIRILVRIRAAIHEPRAERDRIVIPLTQGNINNNHVYLARHLGFFPADAIGGHNKQAGRGTLLKLNFEGFIGAESTDIDPKHKFFRLRGRAWHDFFERHGLRAGDKVAIERISPYEYLVIPIRAAQT